MPVGNLRQPLVQIRRKIEFCKSVDRVAFGEQAIRDGCFRFAEGDEKRDRRVVNLSAPECRSRVGQRPRNG